MSTREILRVFGPNVSGSSIRFVQAVIRWYGLTSHDGAFWLCWSNPHGGNSVTGSGIGGWYEPHSVEGYLIDTAIDVRGQGGEFPNSTNPAPEMAANGFHQCEQVDAALFAFYQELVASKVPFLLAFAPHEPTDGPVVVFSDEQQLVYPMSAEELIAMGKRLMDRRIPAKFVRGQ